MRHTCRICRHNWNLILTTLVEICEYSSRRFWIHNDLEYWWAGNSIGTEHAHIWSAWWFNEWDVDVSPSFEIALAQDSIGTKLAHMLLSGHCIITLPVTIEIEFLTLVEIDWELWWAWNSIPNRINMMIRHAPITIGVEFIILVRIEYSSRRFRTCPELIDSNGSHPLWLGALGFKIEEDNVTSIYCKILH